MRITKAEPTELFVGPPDAPLQLVRVTVSDCAQPTPIRIDGRGLRGRAVAEPGREVVEVAVSVDEAVVGQRRPARAHVGGQRLPFELTVAEPGWTMFMVSHFHYDPVWWNTQGAYTSEWAEDPPGRARQRNGFDLVHAHLEMARRDPDYKFVLAEVDYLKPYWDTRPEDRADLRRFIAAGRVEVMGGTYNEPNTNLTSPETTIRNLVHGMGFQRHVMGANPATAWQLDVFGHDPQFPGMAADAGLTSSSWARGPHHQWGPALGDGDIERMQFASEFEWISPSGRGLLTHYMPAHYSAGWWMDSAASLGEAEDATYELFDQLKKVALTRNVLLPVGTDYTPPNKWVTDIHRDWAARYTWPRFVCALPCEFFAAVRAELAQRDRVPSPQTRDMNPIYTGKDVSYIDTKQANRAAENAVLQAERFAVFAGLLTGAEYPQAALAKAWVQLVYGAHHDAITGSESDQVYLDLLTGWRDAWELGRAARDNALALLSGEAASGEGDVIVWNPLTCRRTDIVTARLDPPLGARVRVLDADGAELAAHVEHDGRSVSWLAREVPSLGWRAYRLVPAPGRGEPAGWEPVAGSVIANEHYRIRVDPARGGGVASLLQDGAELIADGRVGNELAVYEEYPAHPRQGEGPWHLLPKGPVVRSSEEPARVQAFHGPLGQRVVVHGRIGTLLRYTQTLTLLRGLARVDCRTTIDEFSGADQLVRLRWPCPVPGAMPVSEVGDAVVGRGFALLHDGPDAVDTARHPWTLDNPAYGWFGLSSAARIRVSGTAVRAVSVAEVVSPTEAMAGPLARELMVALVRAGVTATCSAAGKPRYGHLEVDSNLPDVRIVLGGPARNAFAAAVLGGAPAYADELERQLAATGRAVVWVPAETPLDAVWVPDADLRSARALPVLVIDGRDEDELRAAIAAVAGDLGDAEIAVPQQPPAGTDAFEDRTVALLNRGVPSFAVDTEGTLHTALMRSCTGWPSGIWIDDPRRTAPDGSNFQLQHWTHAFDYALVSGAGDWRQAEIPTRSAQFAQPLLAVRPGRRGAARGGGPPACGRIAAARRARIGTAGRPQGRRQPTDRGPRGAAEPERGGPAPGGDHRRRHPRHDRLRRRDAARPAARRSAGNPPRGRVLGRAAWLPGGDRAGPRGRAPGGGRRRRPGPARRGRAAAVRTVLAAQSRPRAARRAAGGRPPEPAAGERGARRRGVAAPHRGMRQHRRHAARHRHRPVSGRLDGQARRIARHDAKRRPLLRRRGGVGLGARRTRPLSGPRRTPRHRRRRPGLLAPARRGRLRGDRGRAHRRAGLPRRGAHRGHARTRRSGCFDRHRRQPRRRRPGAGGAPDQPLGHLGMDGPGRPRRGATRPRHRRPRLPADPAGLAGTRPLVGAGTDRLRRPTGLLAGGEGDGDMSIHPIATVAGVPVPPGVLDAAEARLRAARGPAARGPAALPVSGTSEGRQLRRWLTQLIVTGRVVAAEAEARGLSARGAPSEAELLPDVTARLEIGSVAAAVLADPRARALFADVTASVRVADTEVAGYHDRNPLRFAAPQQIEHGWRTTALAAPPLDEVRSAIEEHLRGAARRRTFRLWLDARRAALVELAPGYEHPGDPRQPDNTHRH